MTKWCCAAVHRSLRNKARERGQDVYEHLKRYSDNVFNRARTDRRRWIAWLTEDLAEPRYWPQRRRDGKRHPPWEKTRRHWRKLLRHARWLWGSDINPCKGEPTDWGNDADRARYMRHNPQAVEIECGPPGGNGNHWLRRRPPPEGNVRPTEPTKPPEKQSGTPDKPEPMRAPKVAKTRSRRAIVGEQQRSPATVPAAEAYRLGLDGDPSYPVGPARPGAWPPKKEIEKFTNTTARKAHEERTWRVVLGYTTNGAVAKMPLPPRHYTDPPVYGRKQRGNTWSRSEVRDQRRR